MWIALTCLALFGTFLLAEPGMFPAWDESVFYSQSGDIVGVDSDPSGYSPSREPGTPLLIAGLRFFGLNLESIRISFMLIYTLASAVGFYLLAPTLRWGSVAGFVAMVGHWIPLAYSWRFFGVPIASALLILSIGLGVRMFDEPDVARRWWWAAALAVSSAGMLAMRHLEGWIAAGVLWLVLLGFAVRRREGLVRYVVVAGVVSFLLFSSLEVYRAVLYHGSVIEWIEALRGQLSGVAVNEDTADVRLVKVIASLGGAYHLWLSERIPTASVFFTGIAAVLLLVAWLWRRGFSRNTLRSTSSAGPRSVDLLWWMAIGLILLYVGLFTLGRFPSDPKDRYLMWFVASGGLLLGLLLRGSFRPRQSMVLVIAASIWLVGSVAAAQHDTTVFLENGAGLRELGLTMHVLANGDECVAAARYSSPAIQLSSGCQVRSIRDANEARAWLLDAPPGSVRFLVFPDVTQLEEVPGWRSATAEGSSQSLWFRDLP